MASRSKYVNRNVGQEVYVIEHSEGFVKVGRSKDPDERCRNLNRNCPACVLSLVETFDVGGGHNPALVENHVHEVLSDHEVQSEWFDLDVERAVEAVGDAIIEYESENEPVPEPEESHPGGLEDIPESHTLRVFKILDESDEAVMKSEVAKRARISGSINADILQSLREAGVAEREFRGRGSFWSICDDFEESVGAAVRTDLFPTRAAAIETKLGSLR